MSHEFELWILLPEDVVVLNPIGNRTEAASSSFQFLRCNTWHITHVTSCVWCTLLYPLYPSNARLRSSIVFPQGLTGEKCPSQGVICNSCGASNHFARVFMKSKRATVTHRSHEGTLRQRRVNAVAIDPDEEEYTDSMQSGDDSGDREVNTVQIRTLWEARQHDWMCWWWICSHTNVCSKNDNSIIASMIRIR